MPRAKAVELDTRFTTSSGFTFVELVEAREVANQRAKARRASAKFDVFLASPMASADEYVVTRNLAQSLVDGIENHTDLRVYFAGRDIATMEDFESTDIAWRVNREALESSRCFVLYLPERIEKPSSVWVEAGMALAWRIPSIYFVPDLGSLPYILQRAVLPRDRGGPEVASPRYIGEKNQEPLRLHGREVFADYL